MSLKSIPSGLQKYIVKQNYKRYTSEDQAIWCYIMKKIKNNLSLYGYQGSLSGMEKAGITFNRIPRIEEIDQKLQRYNWRAVPISGFIPPAAFMEFQLNKILPIASELRTLDHISYTPAPDIVHETVGHVPFLTNPIFSKFLETYAQVVKKSIFNKEDVIQYEAIRVLSDLKENPRSTKKEIEQAESQLKELTKNKKYISESSALSRFIWWTSEYGLIKQKSEIKIFGAGLISSPGEGKHSMSDKVKKIPLTKNCLDYDYDITQFQPQLFVAESFEHLLDVLDDICETLSWKTGGLSSIQKAVQSQTLNTVVFNNGLQISGVLESYESQNKNISFLKFKGPCQLSFKDKELPYHGIKTHGEGYSTPLGLLKNYSKPLEDWTENELSTANIKEGQVSELQFQSGIKLRGELIRKLKKDNKFLLLTFKNTRVTYKDEILFEPSWGEFDLGLGQSITSVSSGPADKKAYGEVEDNFKPSKIESRVYSDEEKKLFQIYTDISYLNGETDSLYKEKLQKIFEIIKQNSKPLWLIGLELLEKSKNYPDIQKQISFYLEDIAKKEPSLKTQIREGKSLYS